MAIEISSHNEAETVEDLYENILLVYYYYVLEEICRSVRRFGTCRVVIQPEYTPCSHLLEGTLYTGTGRATEVIHTGKPTDRFKLARKNEYVFSSFFPPLCSIRETCPR